MVPSVCCFKIMLKFEIRLSQVMPEKAHTRPSYYSNDFLKKLYATITDDKYDTRDRKNEYLTIFSIIIFISTIMLYLFNNSSQSLVSSGSIDVGSSSPKMNDYTKPPF